jgi:NADH-ubiquinone oxidoreductase chain 2
MLFIFILTISILSINSFFTIKTVNFRKSFLHIKNLRINNQNNIEEKNSNIKSLDYNVDSMSEQFRIIEYPLIILFCISGAIFLMLSFDIVSIFLSIELQSYALYLICSIYRNSESSVSAGLTYFLLGGLSSCIILLGISLLYVNSGSTNLENFYMINNIYDMIIYNMFYIDNNTINTIINVDNNFSSIFTQYIYLQISLVIMSIGFLFKIAAAPFHFWSPDVYDAVPTIVTTFVAIIPKISIIIFLYKLLYFTYSDLIYSSWVNNIIISSILSLIIGSILGLTQYRIKRLYAYSTISHIGFILLGLSINNLESSKAMFFYIIQYSFSNLNAFLLLIAIAYTLKNYILDNKNFNVKDYNYSPIQYISQLKGYFNINPLLATSLSITLFSFAGLPPLIGFFGKQMILTASINNGFIFITIIAILTSVISAVYYLIIIKMIFFEKSNYITSNNTIYKEKITVSSNFSFLISILTLIITFFIFFDNEIFKLLNII